MMSRNAIASNFQTLALCIKLPNPRNTISCNMLLRDFCRYGLHQYALKTIVFMQKNSLLLDSYSFCSSLISSSFIKDLHFGQQIHAQVAKTGWLSSVFVGSSLVAFYCKTTVTAIARIVYDEIPVKNTVCANALLSGYIDAELWNEAIELVRIMPTNGLLFDYCSVLALLRASTKLSDIELGRKLHAFIFRKSYELQNDVFLQSSLIEMYGKCGYVTRARQIFYLDGFQVQGEKHRDIVLCTSMLGVYGRNGYFAEVIELYQYMLTEGITPDSVAFITILAACCHTGQVRVGLECFESMSRDFLIEPSSEHYSCMIDMLCRAGELDKAWQLVNEMIKKGHESSSVTLWGALLSACEEFGNVELGELAARTAVKLQPDNVGVYIQLSNLYAKYNMWSKFDQLREMMKSQGLKKDVGCSRISL